MTSTSLLRLRANLGERTSSDMLIQRNEGSLAGLLVISPSTAVGDLEPFALGFE